MDHMHRPLHLEPLKSPRTAELDEIDRLVSIDHFNLFDSSRNNTKTFRGELDIEEPVLGEHKWRSLSKQRPPCRGDTGGDATEYVSFLESGGGVIIVEGPGGQSERIRISRADTSESIERCLCRVFGLEVSTGVVLRDSDGYVVPLGRGLIGEFGSVSRYRIDGVCTPMPTPPEVEELEVMAAKSDPMAATMDDPASPLTEVRRANTEPNPHVPQAEKRQSLKWNEQHELEEECNFWVNLANPKCDEGWEATPTCNVNMRTTMNNMMNCSLDSFFRAKNDLDCFPQKIEDLFEDWSDHEGFLDLLLLRERLDTVKGINLTMDDLKRALNRVMSRFSDSLRLGYDTKIPKEVFASIWQRLHLGLACNPGGTNLTGAQYLDSEEVGSIKLMNYTPDGYSYEMPSQLSFLFGGTQRGHHEALASRLFLTKKKGPPTRWAWIENTTSELIDRVAVKFFLHPLAVLNVKRAATEGATKIDRYRHQYVVSLEVYAIDTDLCTSFDLHAKSVWHRISRSTMTLVATGAPPTRARNGNERRSRDWLLSIIDTRQGDKKDPLGRFRTDKAAAGKVLQSVKEDLSKNERLREFQADFLLYTVVHRATQELTPIYNAYGVRLSWLKERLVQAPLSMPTKYLVEVSYVKSELQELQQWISSLRGILEHLESECIGNTIDEDSWHFGVDAKGKGVGMSLFIRHTQVFLTQAEGRLRMLDDLVKTFVEENKRYRSDFMSNILFAMTLMTFVFMPAQLMSGIYGMNFVFPDSGLPQMPLAGEVDGYNYFWLILGAWFFTITCFIGIASWLTFYRGRKEQLKSEFGMEDGVEMTYSN